MDEENPGTATRKWAAKVSFQHCQKITGTRIRILLVQAGDGWRGSPGRAGVLEVPGGAADAAGGADQHAPLQDDARHAQGRAEQAAQGRC